MWLKHSWVQTLLFAGLCGAGVLAHAESVSSPVAATQSSAATIVLATGPAGSVSRSELEESVQAHVPEDERPVFWAVKANVERMVRSLYSRRVLAQRAVQEGVQLEGPELSPANREQELAKRYIEQQIQSSLPDEEGMKRYAQSEYKAQPERFMLPEQVHTRHIMLRATPDTEQQRKQEADALVKQLHSGADFADLARAHSEDENSASQGGDLGWLPRGSTEAAFEHAAFELKQPGDISAPVLTSYGWHIIQLQEHQPAEPMNFENALEQVRAQLLHRHAGGVSQRLWQEAGADAELNMPAIERMIGEQMLKIDIK